MCTPLGARTVLATIPVFYIAKAPNPSLEARLAAAGLCGRIEHVPALMSTTIFPAGTADPFVFSAARPALRGRAEGAAFEVLRHPAPPRTAETCPSPSLAEVAILLSHLRAMAAAHRHLAHAPAHARRHGALIVEEDVDVRLLGEWTAPSGSAPAAADRLWAALPPEWGLLQLSLITTSAHYRRLAARHAAGGLLVRHEELVDARDGKNEGWSTAAYAVSTRALHAMLARYWPGGPSAAAAAYDSPAPAPVGTLDLRAKPCLRADWLLYDGHVAPTLVSVRPMFLFGAGSASHGAHGISGVQIAAVRRVLTLLYGWSKERAKEVTRQNSPVSPHRTAAPPRRGQRAWQGRR